MPAPPLGVRQVPFPLDRGLGWASLGFVPFWPWMMMPAQVPAATAALVPLPEDAPVGGMQLDVQPWQAQVFVDGAYVGRVADFNGYYHHLDLVAGPHVIAIVAPDYQPLTIDVMVSPGTTATYRGTLARAPDR